MTAAGRRSHLAPTFSTRLVAVKVEALVCLTVTGAAGLVTPPASGTRQVGPGNIQIRLHYTDSCLLEHTTQQPRSTHTQFDTNVENGTFSRSSGQSSFWDSHRCNHERSSASWCRLTRAHRGLMSMHPCSWCHSSL